MVSQVQLKVGLMLISVECSCGGVYAVNETFYNTCRERGGGWSCPYCKGWASWKNDTENAKLKRELEAAQKATENERKRTEWAQKDAENEREKRRGVDRQLRAQRGATKRIKNRVANGVCPCCTRSFTNLHRHMQTKHPNFRTQTAVAIIEAV